MGERKRSSCPADAKCPSNRYCVAAAISPARSDGVKGKTVKQRQMSALNKMRLINKARKAEGRPRAELYKASYDVNGNLNPAKNGKPGHILAYACYPLTDHQKKFAEENKAFSVAFTKGTKHCTKDNGYDKSWQRSKCISEFINSDPDVIALKESRGI